MSMVMDREHGSTVEESSRRTNAKDKETSQTKPERCARCGCQVEPYEVFAGRIRGLRKPVCVGCLASAVVFMRDELLPLLEGALKCMEPGG